MDGRIKFYANKIIDVILDANIECIEDDWDCENCVFRDGDVCEVGVFDVRLRNLLRNSLKDE